MDAAGAIRKSTDGGRRPLAEVELDRLEHFAVPRRRQHRAGNGSMGHGSNGSHGSWVGAY